MGLVLVAAAVVLYRSTALWLWNAWTTDPYDSHGLVVAAVAIVLAVLKLRRGTPGDPRMLELVGLPAAAGAYLAGFALHNVYVLAWSAWALLGAVALATGGLARLRALAAPLLLAALAIPVPFALDVGVALQRLAFLASAGLLSLFHVGLVAGL